MILSYGIGMVCVISGSVGNSSIPTYKNALSIHHAACKNISYILHLSLSLDEHHYQLSSNPIELSYFELPRNAERTTLEPGPALKIHASMDKNV